MEVVKPDMIWLISGVTILQKNETDLVLTGGMLTRGESADKPDSIPILVRTPGPSTIRDARIQTECSCLANLEPIDLCFKDINPHDTGIVRLKFRPKKVKISDKKVKIKDAIQISGKLIFIEDAVPVKNMSLFISLIDKQGCILHGHVQQCRTNQEGQFTAEIETGKLQWHLRSTQLAFYTELRLELTFKYNRAEAERFSKYTVITSCHVEDSFPSMQELNFNFEQLQAENWDLRELEEESKWEWPMVPVIRKQQEKLSSILTHCEICNRHIGVGKKRFRQCSHRGRWIGVKCDSCWDSSTIFMRTNCIVCSDIHRRSLETIRENEPKT